MMFRLLSRLTFILSLRVVLFFLLFLFPFPLLLRNENNHIHEQLQKALHMLNISRDYLGGVDELQVNIQDLSSQQIQESLDIISHLFRSIPLFHLVKIIVRENNLKKLDVKRIRRKGHVIVNWLFGPQHGEQLVA